MKDIKEFIEGLIPQMDSPEKVYKLFDGLGYKTLDPSFRGKEASLKMIKEIPFLSIEVNFFWCGKPLPL